MAGEAAASAPAGVGSAAPPGAVTQTTGAPTPSVTPPGMQRKRMSDFSSLFTQPPPKPVAERPAPEFRGMDNIPDVGTNAEAQAMVVSEPDAEPAQQPEVLQAEIIGPDGQTISWEQYQALQQKWDALDLHEELHDKFVVAKIDGRQMRIPVREAVQGYQRARDYSNGMAEVAAGRRANEQTRQGFLNVLNDMNTGESFLRMVRAFGKMPGFEEAAKLYAVEWDAERRMTPQQRALLQRQRQLEQENYQLKMREQQLRMQAQQAPQQPNQQAAFIQHQLAQMIPIAAKRVGLEGSPLAQQLFELHMQQMMPTLQGGEITTEFVMQVMQAAKEDHDLAVQNSQATMQRQQPRTPPVQRLPAAAPPANGMLNPNGTPKRMRIGEMNRVLSGR